MFSRLESVESSSCDLWPFGQSLSDLFLCSFSNLVLSPSDWSADCEGVVLNSLSWCWSCLLLESPGSTPSFSWLDFRGWRIERRWWHCCCCCWWLWCWWWWCLSLVEFFEERKWRGRVWCCTWGNAWCWREWRWWSTCWRLQSCSLYLFGGLLRSHTTLP